jgi:Zn-dependent protease
VLLADPEPTPMDLHFRLFGTYVRVHPLFWLITGIMGFLNAPEKPVLPGNGLGEVVLFMFCAFVSILLHEFGHVWMGRLFGSEGHIVLHSLGGLAIGSNNLSARWKRILVSFAGPGIQLLLFAALYGLIWAGLVPKENKALTLLVVMLLIINFFWPLFNLLPVWPLDGGMITREVCTGVAPSRGLIISLWISVIVSALIAINSLMEMSLKKPLIPYIPSGGMFTIILFAMFAASSFQSIQEETHRRRYSYDDDLPWER